MNHCNGFAPCGPSIGQYKFLFLFLYTCMAYHKQLKSCKDIMILLILFSFKSTI